MRVVLIIVGFLASACGGGAQPETVRSPTRDYPLPPPQTPDGRVMGADQVPPEDKLATSPAITSEGVRPAARPAGLEPEAEHDHEEPPRPCEEIGRTGPDGKTDCPPGTGRQPKR